MITFSNSQTEREIFEEYIEIKGRYGSDDRNVLKKRDDIFFRYRHLSEAKAKRYARNSMPYRSLIDPSDIRNEADIGLLQAINSFSLDRETAFETHAYTRISGSIIDGIRSLQEFPRIVARIKRELNPLLTALSNELGHSVTLEELSIRYPNTVIGGTKTIEEIARDPLVSANVFSQPMLTRGNENHNGDDESYNVIEQQLIKTRSKKQLDRAELSDTVAIVLQALDSDDLERRVIYCYFFLGMTSTKISKTMRISPTWVSDKKASGLQKLKIKARTDQSFADELRRLSFC